MRVYRLEDEQGNGPFWTGNNQKAVSCLIKHNDPTETEMLSSAGLKLSSEIELHSNLVFGWKSKSLMKSFIKRGCIEILVSMGYRVNCYIVPKSSTLRFHDGQVMFHKKENILVEFDSLGWL